MTEAAPSKNKQAEHIQHELNQLKIVDVARNLAFPVAVIGAGLSTLSGVGIIFPAVAAAGFGFTLFGRWYRARRSRN